MDENDTKFSFLPHLLKNLMTRFDWRLNIYFDVDMLILAHVLDPKVGFTGL